MRSTCRLDEQAPLASWSKANLQLYFLFLTLLICTWSWSAYSSSGWVIRALTSIRRLNSIASRSADRIEYPELVGYCKHPHEWKWTYSLMCDSRISVHRGCLVKEFHEVCPAGGVCVVDRVHPSLHCLCKVLTGSDWNACAMCPDLDRPAHGYILMVRELLSWFLFQTWSLNWWCHFLVIN